MLRYDRKVEARFRVRSLYDWGHYSSIWYPEAQLSTRGHVVEIVAPEYVSGPCWKAIRSAADHVDIVTWNLGDLLEPSDYDPELETAYRFSFSDFDIAKEIALKVQQSARDKRKDAKRRQRLDRAGGFHNKWALTQLFEIQQGRCYYSGDPLSQHPKNFVADHIRPVYLGGTDWPGNLALVVKEINTWKGGLASSEDTLQWLGKERGRSWLRVQRAYCRKVDKARRQLDREFRHQCRRT